MTHTRTPAMVGGHFLTVPLEAPAQHAAEAVLRGAVDELAAALAPYGVAVTDVQMPTLHRLVYDDELELIARGRRARARRRPDVRGRELELELASIAAGGDA